jgi:hypothetical protein
MVNDRRFPPPWHADKIPGGYVVRDANAGARLQMPRCWFQSAVALVTLAIPKAAMSVSNTASRMVGSHVRAAE